MPNQSPMPYTVANMDEEVTFELCGPTDMFNNENLCTIKSKP